jgi:heterodisulfide reductase subunit C2
MSKNMFFKNIGKIKLVIFASQFITINMSHFSIYSHGSLAEQISNEIHVSSAKCYQCGKCSAGCPVSTDMDFPPSMVMRLLQTQSATNDEKLLHSYSIWMCVTCEMCYGRCPMEIDIPKIMDLLREKSLNAKKYHPKAKNIVKFHKAFLGSVKNTGRLSEFGLILSYKMSTFNLTQDVGLAPKMMSRGKLHFIPEKIKNRSGISRIFNKTLDK